MNILNSYKRTRFFLWVNITGLAIGLAASIMLLLFVVNELSYDKHFANNERIVRLLTVYGQNGDLNYSPINLRTAYTELPATVPGIEAATQVFNFGHLELIAQQKRFQKVHGMLADPEFFRVFQMKFIEGAPETSLAAPNAAVLTHRYAELIFGSPEAAMNQSVSFAGGEYVVSGVVEELPKNTHFSFDILFAMESAPFITSAKGLEFHTFYLIQKEVSVKAARSAIEKEYLPLIKPWGEGIGDPNAHGETEMLGDIYLSSKAKWSLGATSDRRFTWLLTGLALFILVLAVTNFINLYVTQGEMRMNEIGIRKTNGAQIKNIVYQFFSEVSLIVLIAFVVGFFIAIICIPYFGELINKNIDLMQLLNPSFIVSILLLFLLTVVLSAFYPAIYLSRFSPLEILGKRIKFSKRKLTATIVIFQSILSIVLLSVILVLYKQTAYLEKLPLGYNPQQVMSVIGSEFIDKSYEAVRQELLKQPEIKAVAGSQHIFGGGCSGQVIAPWDDQEKKLPINEYRLLPDMPELMELELVEGRFFQESDPDSANILILNEAAVKMLGGDSPLEKTYRYHEQAKVVGVVKDFYYDNPVLNIAPIVLTRISSAGVINIRFNENVNAIEAEKITLEILRQFDSEFVLNPLWNTDIYTTKFKEIKTITRLVLISSLVSLFIAMLGLLAIHLFTARRRIKEIGIRRIHGAEKTSVFVLLSLDVLKWIGIAAVIAIPIAGYFISDLLNNYANHIRLDWTIFVLPVIIQCVIALITTSGVSIHVLSQNPVKALKSE
jgi:putative ABC transport system permease protein